MSQRKAGTGGRSGVTPPAEVETQEVLHRLITAEIPSRVAADTAYQNARKNSDRQNARIEHDRALDRVMSAVLKDDTQLFGQFSDNESFRRWMTDTIFGLTYERGPDPVAR